MALRHIIFLATLIAPTIGHSADIAGSIKESTYRPAKNAKVTIQCPNTNTFEATANSYGLYRISGLPDLNWCEISVHYDNKQSNSTTINTGSGSKDINLRLRPFEGGWKLIL